MPDTYASLINTPVGRVLAKQVGLPQPPRLRRHETGAPVIDGPVLFGAVAGGRLAKPVCAVLEAIGAEAHTPMQDEVRNAAAQANLRARVFSPDSPGEQTFKALIFDATGISSSEELHELWAFFHPTIRRVRPSGRVLVLGTPPESCRQAREAVAQRALEGLTRSIAKEVGRGATGQLVHVAPRAENQIESTLRFLLSPKSAYVSGQVIRINPAKVGDAAGIDWERPLAGRVALVTGASRGIGSAIARVLSRDGAHVIALDVPAQASALAATAAETSGSQLALDITDPNAPSRIADHLSQHHDGRLDVLVHNAGITRDKTLARMSAELWDSVIEVNLSAPERINAELHERGMLREGNRIVLLSSISGIAGNAGQTNYATSKAGLIGLVEAHSAQAAKEGRTINAVAPGFIETQMTQAMPIMIREAGRRMNSMSQGGLPLDVAETIAWYSSPASSGVNGNVVRVCGQSLLGA
jgi:3-oxoacyl-[acyl-carrier protein] reductase